MITSKVYIGLKAHVRMTGTFVMQVKSREHFQRNVMVIIVIALRNMY